MIYRSRSKESGFTLVEVMVASFLTLLILGGLLMSFVVGRSSASIAKHKAQAMYLIQQRMEQFRSMEFDKLVATGDNMREQVENSIELDNYPGAGEPLLCSRRTVVNNNPQFNDAVEITVVVSWTQRTMGGSIDSVEKASTTLFKDGV